METGRVPSQLVIEVGFEGGVWRQVSTTGGRPESYRAEVGLDNGHGERMQRQGMRTAGPAAWLWRAGIGELKGVASSSKPLTLLVHPGGPHTPKSTL